MGCCVGLWGGGGGNGRKFVGQGGKRGLRESGSQDRGDLRVLCCNLSCCFCCDVLYKLVFVSLDVIHSFVILVLGLKVDCIPGRLNEVVVFVLVPGMYYGQCSELCGVLHGFMPITIMFY